MRAVTSAIAGRFPFLFSDDARDDDAYDDRHATYDQYDLKHAHITPPL